MGRRRIGWQKIRVILGIPYNLIACAVRKAAVPIPYPYTEYYMLLNCKLNPGNSKREPMKNPNPPIR